MGCPLYLKTDIMALVSSYVQTQREGNGEQLNVRTIIVGNRLILREMTPEDFAALSRVLSDPDVMRHYPRPFDAAEVRAWIARNIERYRVLGFGLWAVCLKETGAVIGDCGLTMQNIDGLICPEIGYHIRKDQQGKGYAKEAAAAVRDWAFETTPFQTLFSYCKYTNAPSCATAASIGMRFIKEFADEVNTYTRVYAITKSEWLRQKSGNR